MIAQEISVGTQAFEHHVDDVGCGGDVVLLLLLSEGLESRRRPERPVQVQLVTGEVHVAHLPLRHHGRQGHVVLHILKLRVN